MRPLHSIAQYTVREVLGNGAFSYAYLADGREGPVVVKALRTSLYSDRGARARFYREVANVAALERTGLTRLLDAGEDDDVLFYVLPFREGRSLAAALREGPLSAEAATRVFRALARRLDALHAAGFVHRDVKPENVIVDTQGEASLIDLGLAAHVATVTEGETVGTLQYSAPEQLGVVHRPVLAPADLYSLGVVLYESLTGRLPCPAGSLDDVLTWHMTGAHEPVARVRPDVPAPLDALVEALLARDPDDRVVRAAEASRALLGEGAPLQRTAREAMRHRTPCLGRRAELAAARDALHLDGPTPDGAVVLAGSSLVGRDDVLAAIAARGDDRGTLTLSLEYTDERAPFASLSRAVARHLGPVIARGGPALDLLRARALAAAGDFAPILKRLCAPLEQLLGVGDASRALELTQDATRFAEIVADFLAALGAAHGGLLLLASHADHLDEASLRVLANAHALGGVAVALSCSEERAPALAARFNAVTVTVGALRDEGLRDVLEHVLGAGRCPDALVQHVALCVGTMPFAVQTWTRALVDAGALRLADHGWTLREDRAATLALPGPALDALRERADAATAPVRALLDALALLGVPARTEVLTSALRSPLREIAPTVTRAERAGLIVVDGEGALRVVHPELAQHLRERIPADAARALHTALADAVAAHMPDDTFLEAQHRLDALPEGDAARAFKTALHAGRRALAAYANDVAYSLLSRAAPLLTDDADAAVLHEALGQACTRVARVGEALAAYERALGAVRSPVDAARIQMQIARVNLALWNADGVQRACEAARTAMASALPAGDDPTDVVSRVERARDAGAPAARWIPAAVLLGSTFALWGFMAWSNGDRAKTVAPRRELARVVALVGEHPEGIELEAWLGFLCAINDLADEAMERGSRALARAREGTDRAVEANAQKLYGWSLHIVGRFEQHEELQEDALRRFRRWLSARDLVAICNEYGLALLVRGLPVRAEAIARIGLEIADTNALPSGMANIRATLASALAMRGDLMESAALLDEAREIRASRVPPRDVWTGTWIAQHRMIHLFEQNEQGESLDALLDEGRAIRSDPRDWPEPMASFFVFGAHLLARRAERTGEPAHLDALRRAIDDVTATCTSEPIRRAHERVLRATLWRLSGRSDLAHDALRDADAIVSNCDESWARFEILRARTHVADAPVIRTRLARDACELARRNQWGSRERMLLRDYPDAGDAALSRPPSLDLRGSVSSSGRVGGHGRVFDALLRVSLALQSTRDPEQQARAVLDELLVAFGGERAMLFSLDDRGDVRPVLGRAAGGRDLREMQGFAATLVRRVAATGVAQVLAGTEEGAVLGSKSAVAHDLRSIMAAPVRAGARTWGVVYVDSRVVRGLYHRGDLDVLVAMAAHIGAGFESADLARLEIAERELRKDLELSGAVQRLFFPRAPSADAGPWRFGGVSHPASQCGGDWWWWQPRGDGAVLVLGDVTGHGAAPAMLTAAVASVVRACLRANASLEETLRAVHDELVVRCEGEYQMQAAAIELRPDGTLSLRSAGAPPPLVHDGASSRALVARGSPLGGRDFVCGAVEATLSAGARMLLYSDGVTETVDAAGRAFGARRLQRALGEVDAAQIPDALAALDRAVTTFRGEAQALDDRTLVMVTRR